MFGGSVNRKKESVALKDALCFLAHPEKSGLPEHSDDLFLRVIDLCKILDHSPTGRKLLKSCADQGVEIGVDPQLGTQESCYYPFQRRLDLEVMPQSLKNTAPGLANDMIALVGGLRRIWHNLKGHTDYLSFSVADFLKLYRFDEADCEAVTTLICWELRNTEFAFIWRQLISSTNGDIAVVFLNSLSGTLNGPGTSKALRAAFDQWFAEAARNISSEHQALEFLDDLLLKKELPPEFGHKSLGVRDILKLGRLPGGQNYLRIAPPMGGWYEGLQDDINRAHFRHILTELQSAN